MPVAADLVDRRPGDHAGRQSVARPALGYWRLGNDPGLCRHRLGKSGSAARSVTAPVWRALLDLGSGGECGLYRHRAGVGGDAQWMNSTADVAVPGRWRLPAWFLRRL